LGMAYMFENSRFNGDISNWNVSNVRNMAYMFKNSRFNGDISNWDVSNIRNMDYMFKNSNFNGDISNWNISNVTNMKEMFKGVTLSTENYDALLSSWSNLTLKSNVKFDGGNSHYCLAETARQNIKDTYSWSIRDKGKECPTLCGSIYCSDTQTCVADICIDNCDDTHNDGYCDSNKVCFNGSCIDECNLSHKGENYYCDNNKICSNTGVCTERCDDTHVGENYFCDDYKICTDTGVCKVKQISGILENITFLGVETLKNSDFEFLPTDEFYLQDYNNITIDGKNIEIINNFHGSFFVRINNQGLFKRIIGINLEQQGKLNLVPNYDIETGEKTYLLLTDRAEILHLSFSNGAITAFLEPLYYYSGRVDSFPIYDCHDINNGNCTEKTYIEDFHSITKYPRNPIRDMNLDEVIEDYKYVGTPIAIIEEFNYENSHNYDVAGTYDGGAFFIYKDPRENPDEYYLAFTKSIYNNSNMRVVYYLNSKLPGAEFINKLYDVKSISKREVMENGCLVTYIYSLREGRPSPHIYEIVKLKYEKENCTPSCEATEHLEDRTCVPNTKDISCDTNNNNPSNSTDIIADVTITWNSTTQSWPPAPACAWACNNDYHKNLNQCAPNEITTQCADNIQNTPCEVNTLIDVTSVWNSQLNQYVTPECETTFLSNHHEIGDRCVSNTEQVHCTEVTIENGTSIDAMVTINWVDNAWEDVPNCDFNCNEGYHKDGLTCVANTLNCNANQHEENDSCVDNTKMVHCTEIIVENGSSIDAEITINWVDNAWETAPNCDFNCNEGYHKTDDGNACVEDEVSLCKNITCGKYSTCNESTGICECNSPREAYGEDAECVTKQEVVAFNFIKSEITVNYSKLSEVNSLNKIAETYTYKGLSIKPLFKTDGSLSEIEFYNITDDYISVKLDTNKDNDLEEIILEAGRTITLEITAIVKNNDINNLDTEYTLGSTWVADMPSGYRVIKTGEKIDLRLPSKGDGSTGTILGGVGTDYAIEKKYISDKNGNETERILYTSRYQEAHPDSYMTITDSDNKTDILKATEEFKTLSMDVETKKIYVDYKETENLKVDLTTGEITKIEDPTAPSSSNSSCSYSANGSNNIFILLLFMGLIYFRRRKGSMQ